jgi:hypothetical protein
VHGVARNTLDQPGYRRRGAGMPSGRRVGLRAVEPLPSERPGTHSLYSNFNLAVIASTFSLMSGNMVPIARAHQARLWGLRAASTARALGG